MGVAQRTGMGASLALAVGVLVWAHARWGSPLVPWGIASLLAVVGAMELGRMKSLGRQGPPTLICALALAALWFGLADRGGEAEDFQAALFWSSFLWVAAGAEAIGRALGGRRWMSGLLALWCVPALFGLIPIAATWGTAGLITLVLLSKLGDIAGYFVGRAIGKRHPFPGLSPGKTVAGCVASLVAGLAAGAAVGQFGPLEGARWGALGGALAGLTINLASQAGDLAESWVKRRAGVKDSSTWMGPSGGVLDVVDSLLFSIPVALATWPFLFGAQVG